MPVFNEQGTINEIISRVEAVEVDKEIIIVDDFSTDKTRLFLNEIIEANSKSNQAFIPLSRTGDRLRTDNIKVFFHEKNLGKGAALRRGFQESKGRIVIVQDADLEYDPQDYPKLLWPIMVDKADVVYGSRFIGEPHRVLYFYHTLGNKFLTMLSNMFTNLNLTDIETGYKVFRRELIQRMKIEESRFGFEPEITAKLAKLGCRIYEVGISYHGRTYAEGKKVGWRDGISAFRCIVKYNFFT